MKNSSASLPGYRKKPIPFHSRDSVKARQGSCSLQRPKLKAVAHFLQYFLALCPLVERTHTHKQQAAASVPRPGSRCGTHRGGSSGRECFPPALSELVYLSTVIIQLALQLLPPDSLIFQLRLQLPHSPAKSKGDKQSMKHIQTCPGCSTWRSAFAREQVSHAESSAARLRPAVLRLRSLGDSAEQQLSKLPGLPAVLSAAGPRDGAVRPHTEPAPRCL